MSIKTIVYIYFTFKLFYLNQNIYLNGDKYYALIPQHFCMVYEYIPTLFYIKWTLKRKWIRVVCYLFIKFYVIINCNYGLSLWDYQKPLRNRRSVQVIIINIYIIANTFQHFKQIKHVRQINNVLYNKKLISFITEYTKLLYNAHRE